MNKKLVDLIRKKFIERLQAKTNWGRVELLQEHERAINDAVMELLDQT